MVTEREFAISKGLAKPGRGRMSTAAREAIEKAINSGMKFDDPTGKVVLVTSTDENGNKVQTTKRIAEVPDVPDPRTDRPEGMYMFRNPDGSTFERLHTNACSKCFYSFGWCYCVEGPVQWAYHYPAVAGMSDVYATLYRVPGRQVITTDDVPEKQTTRRRGRPKKAVAKSTA